MHFCLGHPPAARPRPLSVRSRHSREGLRHQSHRKRLRHRQRPRAPRSFLSSENRAPRPWNTRSAPARHASRRRTRRPLSTMRLMLSRRAGIWLFLAVAVALGIAALLFPQMDLPPSYTRNSDLLTVAGLYMIAKVCAVADKEIFSLGHAVS